MSKSIPTLRLHSLKNIPFGATHSPCKLLGGGGGGDNSDCTIRISDAPFWQKTFKCKAYIGESDRKLGNRFRGKFTGYENQRIRPVQTHGHSHEHMKIYGLNSHVGCNETRKREKRRLIFKFETLASHAISERFSFVWFQHIFDQLDATNSNQCHNLTFSSA